MIVFFLFFLGVYLAIVHLVSLVLNKLRTGYSGRGITVGALIGWAAALTVVIAASVLVTSDESYWYYGSAVRYNVLLFGTALAALLFLVFGPVVAVRYQKNRGRTGETSAAEIE